MLTRQHFQAIADALADVKPSPKNAQDTTYIIRKQQWDATVNRLVHTCREFNPRFQHQRFLDACERDL